MSEQVVASEPVEIQPQVEESNSVEEGDPYAEAAEVFDLSDEQLDKAIEGQQVETESHVEQEKPQEDVYGLENLQLPHKYRDNVRGHFDPIVKEHQQKVEEALKATEEHQQNNSALLDVIKQAVTNPASLKDLAIKYGEQAGIDPRIVEQYRNVDLAPKTNSPQTPNKDLVREVFDKYSMQLVNEQDPQKFVGTLQSLITDSLKVGRSESRNDVALLMKQAFGQYHNKFVQPTLKTTEEAKSKAQHESRRTSWNDAEKSLSDSFSAEKVGKEASFETHKEAVLKLMVEDPAFSKITESINDNPANFGENPHQQALERAYHIVSRDAQLQAAVPKKEWKGGLKPSAKHVKTKKAQVGDSDPYDEIHRELYPEDFE